MKRTTLFIIAGLIVISLLLFTCTFQVRFNEVGIVTTFRKITSVVDDPGLHFKWPYPIQSVMNYDKRTRILSTRLENIQTKDYQLVVAQVFLTWKISDPKVFYQSLEIPENANKRLDERLRSALGVFSEYNFYDMLTPDVKANKLPEVEDRMRQMLLKPGDKTQGVDKAYGIDPVAIGISQFILPQKTATEVFDRMKKTRERLAANTRDTGDAQAKAIVSKASSDAKTIQYFADRRAAQIRALGDQEAASYAKQLAVNDELAIFLEKIKALKSIIGQYTTVILPNDPPFDIMNRLPQASDGRGHPVINTSEIHSIPSGEKQTNDTKSQKDGG